MRTGLSIPLGLAIGWLAISTAAAAEATPAAEKLARDAVIVDTHIDAPGQLMSKWADLDGEAPDREFDYPRARAGGLDVAFMSIYTSAGQDEAGTAWGVANQMIDAVEALVQRHPDKFALLRSPGDVARLRKGGKVLLPLGMENGAPIGKDLSNIAFFFDRGIRYITLAHSANNALADSSYQRDKKWNGLSPLGRQAVAEMNRLGIMVDVSHLSDDAAAQAIELSTVPVIASHSAFRHFTPGFERNISDALAKQLAAKGGVVQLAFGNGFVDPASAQDLQDYFVAAEAWEQANAARAAAGQPLQTEAEFDAEWKASHPNRTVPIDAVLDQVDHGVALVGIDHLGIGSDFDGVSGNLPSGLKTVADYPRLVAGLQARGYSDADIRKLLGGNLLRTWQAVEDGAGR
ncbi:dipeptidase [Marilutibacter spongiae]|uniref:Membrane dipeptidase n=1 Tax=Marilutibacter spongiae TaxID=2025720 RepID=A0A7W3Y5M3_9GAMM|nr:dipeptidase [Lysobacter spongiae]MBB1060362.1 membrane dipeptidase [Lysobacter spongiae]